MEGQQDAYSPPQGTLIEAATVYNEPKFLALSGRIGRLRYLAYGMGLAFIFYAALLIALIPLGGLFAAGASSSFLALAVMAVLYIPLLVFSWGFMVRRLNDLDRSGWFSLLMFIPLVNFFVALYLIFGRGTDGVNNYGAPPPPNTGGVIVLSCLLPAIFIVGIVAAIALPAYQTYVMRAKAAQQSSEYTQPADDANSSSEATGQTVEQEQPAAESADADSAETSDDATTEDETSTEDNTTDNSKTTL